MTIAPYTHLQILCLQRVRRQGQRITVGSNAGIRVPGGLPVQTIPVQTIAGAGVREIVVDSAVRVRVQIIRHARTHSVGKYHVLNVGLVVHAPVL